MTFRATNWKCVRLSGPLWRRHPYTSTIGAFSRDSAMKQTSDFLVVIPTPFGVIALSTDALRKARVAAENLFYDSIPTRNQSEVAHPTTLLDARATANLFGLDETWFLTRARENRIPHIRMGKYIRFDPAEIRDFFQRNPDRHANSEETHPQQDSDSKG